MPSLQIRKLPEALYEALKAAAEKERRSLSQQAIIVLARGLESVDTGKERRQRLLQVIDQLAGRWSHLDINGSDAVDFIREDRNR